MTDSNNGWQKDQRYIESAIGRIDKSLSDLNKKFDKTTRETAVEIATLKTKMGFIGCIAGSVSAVVVSLVTWLVRGGGHGQ